jgi:hypothetical protein
VECACVPITGATGRAADPKEGNSMKKALFIVLVLAGVTSLSGCISVATPAVGVLFTEVRGPIGGNGTIGPKEGKACAQSILGLIAQGDASISAAAKAGGITNVSTVEHYTRNMLGIIGDFCTIVRGS